MYLAFDRHVMAGITYSGDELGTLSSLYLADERLQRRYRSPGGLTVFLTFGIPLGLGFGIVGGGTGRDRRVAQRSLDGVARDGHSARWLLL